MTAQWVRFSPDLTVPLDVIIFVSTIAGAECLVLRGRHEPMPLGPETAERWRGFSDGSREYPVNVNGVLDLSGHEEAQFIAERVLGGQPKPLFFGDAPEVPVFTGGSVAPTTPKVDFGKVRARMK